MKFIALLIAPHNIKDSAFSVILSRNALFLAGFNRKIAPTVKRDLQKY